MIIRKRVHASGSVAWQLDYGLVEGRRKMISFDSREAAEKALQVARAAKKHLGMLGVMASPAEMGEFLMLRERLMTTGTTLLEAVEFFLLHARRLREPMLLPAAVMRFRDAKEDAGCSVRYHRQLGVSLGSLARWLPLRLVHEVKRDEVEAWLRASGWSAKTRNNYLGDVRAFFSWAMREGLCTQHPVMEIAKARLGDEEIGTLTVAQCELLLRGALKKPEMMGFVVLGLFGGLRPAEIQRLTWAAVDLDEGTVIVAGAQAKTRRRRVVDLGVNACAWLRAGVPASLREGPICGKYWDARWRMFRRSLGWAVGSHEKGVKEERVPSVHGEWPHNALRHTYASMHYSLHQDEAKLQAQMGHESAAMLHRHYRALKTRKEAEQFWSLRP
jgi:integrase